MKSSMTDKKKKNPYINVDSTQVQGSAIALCD